MCSSFCYLGNLFMSDGILKTVLEHIVDNTTIIIVGTFVSALVTYITERLVRKGANERAVKQIKDNDVEALITMHNDKSIENSHKLLVEHYFSRFFKYRLTYPEIMSIMDMSSPLWIFRYRKVISRFVKFSRQDNTYCFMDKYQDLRKRKKFRCIKYAGYFFYVFSGLFLLMFSAQILNTFGIVALTPLTFITITSTFYGFAQLSDAILIEQSEKFMKMIEEENGMKELSEREN